MSKWSLNAKIYMVLGIFIVASAVISFMGVSKMKEINLSLEEIVEGPAKKQRLIGELQSLFFIQLINEKNYILSDTLEEKKVQNKRLTDRDVELRKLPPVIHPFLLAAGQKNLADVVAFYDQWWSLNKEVRDFSLQGKDKEAADLSLTKGREIRLKIEESLDIIVERNNKLMAEEVKHAQDTYESARMLLIMISVGAILLGFCIATMVLRALNTSIKQVINNLTENSNQVSSAAKQIASSSEELSQAATEQAASLEETAASIEELNSMVQKNADNARRASELSTSSSGSAEKGKVVVTDMIRAIEDISESNNTIMHQIDESNQQISDIVKVIAEIGNKTKVINDIVFQTKLLSFNASVEAARAGEHGKGFAVVAEEVGNLAQMSGNAAKEISAMLEGSIQKVEGIVNDTKLKIGQLVNTGKMKVETGTKIAQDCGHVLEEIVVNVNNVSQMANEIANACQEQSQGVHEITKAMNQLDQVTQTNAATSEEAASAAEELSSQSESLKSAVATLVTTVMGDNGKMDTPFKHEISTPAFERKAAPKASGTNVVALKTRPKVEAAPMKKAVGHRGFNAPDENDPRFEDV